MRVVVAMWLVAFGCGDNLVDYDDRARSGARLKLTWHVFEDGMRQWQHGERYYDTKLGDTCAPRGWADGNTYCTPDVTHTLSRLYADADCTMPVAHSPDHRYIGDFVASCGFDRPSRIYRVDGSITLTQVWHSVGDGNCYPGSQTGELGRVTGEITSNDLVRITTSEPIGDARLEVMFHESSDGMRFPAGIHDREVGESEWAGSHVRPLISASLGSAMHTDPRCADPYVGVRTGCPLPRTANDGVRYFRLGEPAIIRPSFVRLADACEQTTTPPDTDFYGVGDNLALARLYPQADKVADRRIQLEHATFESLTVRNHVLYDTVLEVDCTPEQVSDGTTRCVPVDQGTSTATRYTDPTCQTAVVLADVIVIPLAGPPRFLRHREGTTLTLHELGDVHYENVFTRVAGACTYYEPDIGQIYNLGPVVPWSELAAAETRVDD